MKCTVHSLLQVSCGAIGYGFHTVYKQTNKQTMPCLG